MAAMHYTVNFRDLSMTSISCNCSYSCKDSKSFESTLVLDKWARMAAVHLNKLIGTGKESEFAIRLY